MRLTRRHRALENSDPAQATRRRNREPPAQAHSGRGRAGHTPAGERARAMEQRLAEFREARKRAGLVAQPSTSSQSVQVSGTKAEPAAATSKTATGWLRRFLRWKASPVTAQAQPNQPQVRREACTLKLRLRTSHTHDFWRSRPSCSVCSLSSPAQWLDDAFPQCVSAHDTWP